MISVQRCLYSQTKNNSEENENNGKNKLGKGIWNFLITGCQYKSSQ